MTKENPRLPKYIRACMEDRWHLTVWDLETGEHRRVPYRCGSWRHAGACRKARAREDGARIATALERHGGPFAFWVLTLDRDIHPNPVQAYVDIVSMWSPLIRELRKRYGKMDYVAVVEEHSDLYPHLNVVLTGRLAEECRGSGWRGKRDELEELQIRFGFQSSEKARTWIEPVKDPCDTGFYMAKLAGEFAKDSQVPLTAPKGFRRLRASRGFLPKVERSKSRFGGSMEFCSMSEGEVREWFRRKVDHDGEMEVGEPGGAEESSSV